MTVTEPLETTNDELMDELQDWLRDNWDPDLTVAEWWDRLGTSGWSAPLLPRGRYGKGVIRGDAIRIADTIADFGALSAPAGLGQSLAAPTIATHGTDEQVERFVRDLVTGQKAWCQLFSEPGAGSDLAGLQTRAVEDGEEWIVNGQKVWTSGGHMADMGMLLARTHPTAPKHKGISWFAFDMDQPGVEVRPLKEMTGNTMFSEVFLTDAVVNDDRRIGDAHDGWRVAQTTLHYERSGMGAGGGRSAGFGARAGTRGDLDKRAGDFVRPRRSAPSKANAEASRDPVAKSPARAMIELARQFGKIDDPTVRHDLMRAHILGELSRLNTERHKVVRMQGGDIPGMPNFSKLLMADRLRLNRDLGMRIVGARGMLHAYDPKGRADLVENAPGGVAAAMITGSCLQAQALPIYGGTDQVQRNIIGERALGLPKEPGDLAHVPFNELPKNG